MPATARDLFAFALERAEHEYADLSDTWKTLDVKAQATATTAGVFVAAAFVFVRNTSLQLFLLEKILLVLLLVFLLVCILHAVLAMRIREVPIPPTTAEIVTETQEILTADGEATSFDERLLGLVAGAVESWSATNSELREHLEGKADAIALAQNAIVFAMITVAVLISVSMFMQ